MENRAEGSWQVRWCNWEDITGKVMYKQRLMENEGRACGCGEYEQRTFQMEGKSANAR